MNAQSVASVWGVANRTRGAGGAAVAVWHDAAAEELVLATAAHVVVDVADDVFVFDNQRRKHAAEVLVLDKTYDLALLRVRGVPKPVVAVLQPPNFVVPDGTECYIVGWPLLYDKNSVCHGTVRSARWTGNGGIEQMLVSAPTLGGNSGGGVFHKTTHRLLGIVSWKIDGESSFAGAVARHHIYESLVHVLFGGAAPLPTRVGTPCYYVGMFGFKLSALDTDAFAPLVRHPLLEDRVGHGMALAEVAAGSPAAAAGLVGADFREGDYDIVWAVGTSEDTLVPITEETAVDRILYDATRQKSYYPLPARIVNHPVIRARYVYDTRKPLDVFALTTRVRGGLPQTTVPELVAIRAVSRLEVSADPSTFGNEFTVGKLC